MKLGQAVYNDFEMLVLTLEVDGRLGAIQHKHNCVVDSECHLFNR